MIWHTWSDFFHMGGYGLYVWGSFAVTAVLVAGEVALLRQHARKSLEQARRAVEFGKAATFEPVVDEEDEETT